MTVNSKNFADNDTRYHLLRLLETGSDLSQRRLADELGLSVGKVNYCLKDMIAGGLVRVHILSEGGNKSRSYLLTKKGRKVKDEMITGLLQRKIQEKERLLREIEELRREVLRRHREDAAGACCRMEDG